MHAKSLLLSIVFLSIFSVAAPTFDDQGPYFDHCCMYQKPSNFLLMVTGASAAMVVDQWRREKEQNPDAGMINFVKNPKYRDLCLLSSFNAISLIGWIVVKGRL